MITDPWSRVTTVAYSAGLLASVTHHAGGLTRITGARQEVVGIWRRADEDVRCEAELANRAFFNHEWTRIITEEPELMS